MRVLKTVLVFGLLLLTVFAAFGQKKVTIDFMCTEADLPKEWVDQFNAANPDLNLVRVEEDWNKWTADAIAGSASDLIRLGIGTDVAYYSKRGLLYDMTRLMQGSKIVKMSDINKPANASYQFDGKDFGKGSWWGLTNGYNNIGAITYNKEMFNAAGLPMLSETKPITYNDELLILGRKLTKKDSAGHVMVWGYEYGATWVPFLISDMAIASGLSFYNDAQKSVMNQDPKMRELWKYFTRFNVEDVASNIRNPNSGWTGSAFQSDRAAIVQLGYWYGAQLMENKGYNEKYGWAPTPIVRAGAKRVTDTLGGTGTVMYAKTKNPKLAFRVWEWYMGGAYGLARAKTGWGMSSLYSLHKYLPEDNAFNKSRKAIALDDGKYFQPWQASPYITWQQYNQPWTAHIDDLVKGSLNADSFVDIFLRDIDETLKTGREEIGE